MDFKAGSTRRQADSALSAAAGAADHTTAVGAADSTTIAAGAADPTAAATIGGVVPSGAVLADASLAEARGFVPLGELFGRLEEARSALAGFVEGFGSRVPDCREAAALLHAGEQVGRLAERVQLAVVLAADRAVVADVGKPVSGAGKSQFKDTVDFMVSALHIRRGEAWARLNAAKALLAGTGLCGQELAPAFPQLSEAVASGEVPVGTAMIAVRSLQKLKPVVAQRPDGGAEELEKLEGLFAGTARTQPPDIVQASVQRAEGYLDQDGIEPTEALKRELQGAFYKGRKSGLHQWLLSVDNEQNEFLRTVMLTHTNPRTRPLAPGRTGPAGMDGAVGMGPAAGPGNHADHHDTDHHDTDHHGTRGTVERSADERAFWMRSAEGSAADGGASWMRGGEGSADGSAAGMDPALAPEDARSRAQKQLDGVMGAIALALAGGKLPATGGMKPQVIVTIDYQTLLGQVAEAATRTSTSTLQGPFGSAVIRRMACDADIIPVVLGGNGEVLDLGRAQRLFSTAQRKALIARDGGCTGPACTVPADMCEAHHITSWSRGGPTDIANGTILCRYHHAMIHDSDWTIEMAHGIPYWIPPPYLDPRQPRLRNTYFQPATQPTLI